MGIIVKRSFTGIVCLLSFVSFGQEVIEDFTAEHYKGNVLLTWSITQGNTCNGVEVLRSIDSVNFIQIGSIEGICGSTQEAISYSFTDNFPVANKRNYYRLSLGGAGFSKIIAIEIIAIEENSYLIRPNPVSSESELFFENNSVAQCTIRVLDASGKLHYAYETTGNKLVLNGNDFRSGLYFIHIAYSNGNPSVSGRFLVE